MIVADGRSSDETARLAREAGAVVVDNPRRITPAGLNTALAAAQGEMVVRFDAHAVMPPGYVEASIQALDGGAGRCRRRGLAAGRAERALGPRDRRRARLSLRDRESAPLAPPRPGEGRVDVDTFNLGSWRAEDLRAQGGWDERFVRNQDFELNYRLRRAGGRIVFDPAIWSIYHPRESLRAIARQYWGFGRFKALMITTYPRSLEPRQLGPIGLLAAAAAAATPSRLAGPARAAIALYCGVLTIVAARAGGGWRTFPVLATVHASWGAGFLAGLATRLTARGPAKPDS